MTLNHVYELLVVLCDNFFLSLLLVPFSFSVLICLISLIIRIVKGY